MDVFLHSSAAQLGSHLKASLMRGPVHLLLENGPGASAGDGRRFESKYKSGFKLTGLLMRRGFEFELADNTGRIVARVVKARIVIKLSSDLRLIP